MPGSELLVGSMNGIVPVCHQLEILLRHAVTCLLTMLQHVDHGNVEHMLMTNICQLVKGIVVISRHLPFYRSSLLPDSDQEACCGVVPW